MVTSELALAGLQSQGRWWTTAEVARHYGRSVHTLKSWRQQGYGPKPAGDGRVTLYPQSEIDRFDAELLATVGGGH